MHLAQRCGQLGVHAAEKRRPARVGGQQVCQAQREDGRGRDRRRQRRRAQAARRVLDPDGEDQVHLQRDEPCAARTGSDHNSMQQRDMLSPRLIKFGHCMQNVGF